MIKSYTRKELAEEVFGISLGTFANKRKDYLNHLSEYYKWHQEGRKYVLDEEIKPWVSFRKAGRPSSKDEIQKEYIAAIHEIIDNDPAQRLNTGANLARNAKVKNPVGICDKYHHRDRSMRKYFCDGLKIEFPDAEYCWAKRIDDLTYAELTENELEVLKGYLDKHFNYKVVDGEELASIASLYANGEISKSEMAEMLVQGTEKLNNYYLGVIAAFGEEFGYTPIKVKKIEVKAF